MGAIETCVCVWVCVCVRVCVYVCVCMCVCVRERARLPEWVCPKIWEKCNRCIVFLLTALISCIWKRGHTQQIRNSSSTLSRFTKRVALPWSEPKTWRWRQCLLYESTRKCGVAPSRSPSIAAISEQHLLQDCPLQDVLRHRTPPTPHPHPPVEG